MTPGRIETAGGGVHRLRLDAGPMNLAVGRYDLFVTLIRPLVEDLHEVEQPISFEVVHADPGNTGFEFRQSYGFGSHTAPLRVEVL